MYYTTDYSYYTTDYSDAAAATGMAFGTMLLSMIPAIAVAVVTIIAMWKVFKKAGKCGWEAIVPFYNIYTLLEISGFKGAYMFFGFIPFAGPIILLVYMIKAAISLNQKFHKAGGFAVLLILVPVVGYCILGFGKDKYDSSKGAQL